MLSSIVFIKLESSRVIVPISPQKILVVDDNETNRLNLE